MTCVLDDREGRREVAERAVRVLFRKSSVLLLALATALSAMAAEQLKGRVSVGQSWGLLSCGNGVLVSDTGCRRSPAGQGGQER